jgi:hypothetical protein
VDNFKGKIFCLTVHEDEQIGQTHKDISKKIDSNQVEYFSLKLEFLPQK